MNHVTAGSSVHRLDDYRKSKFAPPDYSAGIFGIPGREAFQRAICRCAGLSKAEIHAANMLATFFNCETGRCDPGWTKLAEVLGRDKAAVKRTMKAIEDHGIIKRQETAGGDHDKKINFILFIPPASVTPTARDGGRIYYPRDGGRDASPVEEGDGGHFEGGTGDGFGGDGGRCARRHKNREQEVEQGAPSAHPPVTTAAVVDSQSDPAFVALRRCYPGAPDVGCQDALNQMLIGGVDIDDILDSACAYIERCQEAGREPKPMISFLKHMQENHV